MLNLSYLSSGIAVAQENFWHSLYAEYIKNWSKQGELVKISTYKIFQNNRREYCLSRGDILVQRKTRACVGVGVRMRFLWRRYLFWSCTPGLKDLCQCVGYITCLIFTATHIAFVKPTLRPGLNVCSGGPSRSAKCPGIVLQWNFQN